jgi:hypothetical protein
MKYNEYTIPVEDIVDEAPMGMIKTGLNKLASKIPGSIGAKATGALQTGSNANAMYKEFYTYLGQKGLKPTTGSISAFLQTKGVSPDIIKKYVVAPAAPAANYPQGGAAQPAAGGASPPVQSPAAAPQDSNSPPVQSPAAAPKAPRVRDRKAEAERAAAKKAAAAPQQQATPATQQQSGFYKDLRQTPAQKKTADLLRAAKASQTAEESRNMNEDVRLQQLLSKITKRL